MKGTYTLVINLPKSSSIGIGALGATKFERGYYAYIGSALNGLESRIKRHLSPDKRIHWHIDYLLQNSTIERVIFGEYEKKKECKIARQMSADFPSIEKFGSSDCNCESHLFYSKERSQLVKRIESSFRNENMIPQEWEDGK